MTKIINTAKNVGRGLLSGLGEYFLGTRTRRYFQQVRDSYRESQMNSRKLEKSLEALKMLEKGYLVLGKMVPVYYEILGITNLVAFSQDLGIGQLLVGELIRGTFTFFSYLARKKDTLEDMID